MDSAPIAVVEMHDQIEQRRLAGAVGADDGDDLVLVERKIELIHGANAAKVLRELFDPQKWCLHEAAGYRAPTPGASVNLSRVCASRATILSACWVRRTRRRGKNPPRPVIIHSTNAATAKKNRKLSDSRKPSGHTH